MGQKLVHWPEGWQLLEGCGGERIPLGEWACVQSWARGEGTSVLSRVWRSQKVFPVFLQSLIRVDPVKGALKTLTPNLPALAEPHPHFTHAEKQWRWRSREGFQSFLRPALPFN